MNIKQFKKTIKKINLATTNDESHTLLQSQLNIQLQGNIMRQEIQLSATCSTSGLKNYCTQSTTIETEEQETKKDLLAKFKNLKKTKKYITTEIETKYFDFTGQEIDSYAEYINKTQLTKKIIVRTETTYYLSSKLNIQESVYGPCVSMATGLNSISDITGNTSLYSITRSTTQSKPKKLKWYQKIIKQILLANFRWSNKYKK